MTLGNDATSMDARSSIAAQLTELRQQQFSIFDEDSLAWLAMTPAWTERLAEATNFPTGKWTLQGFLAETEQVRLSQRGPQVTQNDLILRRTRGLMALWPVFYAEQRERLSARVRDGISVVADEIEKLRLLIEVVPFGPQMEAPFQTIDVQPP